MKSSSFLARFFKPQTFLGRGFLFLSALLITFIATALFLTSFLALSTQVSPDRIHKAIEPIAEQFVREGDYPAGIFSAHKYRLDRFTDSLMLQMAIPDPSISTLDNTLLVPYFDYIPEEGNISPVESLYQKISDPSIQNNTDYLTYWLGFLIPLRAALSVLSVTQVVMLNFILLGILAIAVAEIFRRTGGILALVAFLVALLPVTPWLIPQSFQFANMFYLSLLSTIVLFLLLRAQKCSLWIATFFLVAGIATSFFDFLTTPLLTLLLPSLLLVFWRIKHDEGSIVSVISNTILWAVGYIAMWGLKWVVLVQVYGPDRINATFIDSLFMRSGIDGGEGLQSRLDAVRRNLYQLQWNPGPVNQGDFLSLRLLAVILLIVFIVWLMFFLLSKSNGRRLVRAIPLLLIAVAPYLWYFVASNHSYIHFWFTYRAQIPAVAALLMFFVLSINWKTFYEPVIDGLKARPKLLSFLIRVLLVVLTTTSLLVLAISTLTTRGIQWMFQEWTHLRIEELIFTLSNPVTGANSQLYYDFAFVVVPIMLLAIALVVASATSSGLRLRARAFVFVVSAFIGVAFMLSALGYAWNRLEISTFVLNQGVTSDFIDRYYVDPHDIDLVFPEQPRNLIFIYLESMETTFADKESGGAFEVDIIPELTQLGLENETFSGSNQQINGGAILPWGHFTTGGMFAQTAGLPLVISTLGDMDDLRHQNNFFPGLGTLGGILEGEGYFQALLVGSDAEFGGRELYYTEHGNFKIWDWGYVNENGLIPKDHRVWWGFEDWRLYEIAQEKLLEMAAADQPFHLTMLTVDTHQTDGWLCEKCPDSFDTQYANVMHCGSIQVNNFVNWARQQDFFENTTIIISGDHITHDGAFVEGIDSEYRRRTFVAVINAPLDPVEPTWNRQYSTIDMFPTTLAALGVDIPGNQLGLGANLFSDVPTLIERFDLQYVTDEMMKSSEFINNLIRDFEPQE